MYGAPPESCGSRGMPLGVRMGVRALLDPLSIGGPLALKANVAPVAGTSGYGAGWIAWVIWTGDPFKVAFPERGESGPETFVGPRWLFRKASFRWR